VVSDGPVRRRDLIGDAGRFAGDPKRDVDSIDLDFEDSSWSDSLLTVAKPSIRFGGERMASLKGGGGGRRAGVPSIMRDDCTGEIACATGLVGLVN
jgi:hypothetical protein